MLSNIYLVNEHHSNWPSPYEMFCTSCLVKPYTFVVLDRVMAFRVFGIILTNDDFVWTKPSGAIVSENWIKIENDPNVWKTAAILFSLKCAPVLML